MLNMGKVFRNPSVFKAQVQRRLHGRTEGDANDATSFEQIRNTVLISCMPIG